MEEQEAKSLIEAAHWRFAKTMPKNPHEYSHRDKWQNQEKFESLVEYIREYGTPERFWSKTYMYFYYKGWKYWTMGSPIKKTLLINRAKIEEAKTPVKRDPYKNSILKKMDPTDLTTAFFKNKKDEA